MLVVLALTLVHGFLNSQGREMGAGWLVLLLAPGVLAAHLERTGTGVRNLDNESMAGLRAGVVTAHFTALLMSAWSVMAAISIDWARYAEQVGPEVAYVVRDAAVTATVLLVLLAVMLSYVICGATGLLGDLAYSMVRNLVK